MKSREKPIRFAAIPAGAIALVGLCAGTSHAAVATWASPGTDGTWAIDANWDTSPDPYPGSGNTNDVVIDGDGSNATIVTYAMAASSTIGSLTIDSGDRLNLSKTSAGSYSMTAASLTNSGTLVMSASWANNQTFGLNITNAPTSPAVFNSGILTISNTGSRTNPRMSITLPGTNTNASTGVLTAYVNITGGGSGGYSRFALTGTGTQTFTNDGTVSLEAGASRDSGTSTNSQALLEAAASQNLTLAGSGSVALSSLLGTTGGGSFAKITGGASSTLTNGTSHKITGNGIIGGGTIASGRVTGGGSFTSIVNNGLIKSTGTNVSPLAINPTTSGAFTNSARLVAASTAGLFLGNDTTANSFTNNGLLESRTGSIVAFGTAATVTLNGTIAGGGTYTSPVVLSSSATFAPGDLANADGTGASTVGTITVDNTLALGAAANFQLASDASYDRALVNTITNAVGPSLTFDGALNVADLGVTFADGQVFDLFDWGINTTVGGAFDSISLPTLSDGLTWKDFSGQQFDYATGQIVIVPEPASLALAGLLGATLLRRRNHRS